MPRLERTRLTAREAPLNILRPRSLSSSWLPAFADVLIAHQDKTILTDVPASMSEWRQEVAENANPVAEWLIENIEITREPSDCIVLGQLKQLYFASCKTKSVPASNKFPGLSQTFFSGKLHGVSYKRSDRINGDNASHVVRGVRLLKMSMHDD